MSGKHQLTGDGKHAYCFKPVFSSLCIYLCVAPTNETLSLLLHQLIQMLKIKFGS